MNKPKTVSVIVNNEFLLVTSIIRGMIGMTNPDQDFIFNEVDIRKNYYPKPDGGRENAVVMACYL